MSEPTKSGPQQQYRYRILTGSIGLEGPWSEWTDGEPDTRYGNREYETRNASVLAPLPATGSWSGPTGSRKPQPIADREAKLYAALIALGAIEFVFKAYKIKYEKEFETIREALR